MMNNLDFIQASKLQATSTPLSKGSASGKRARLGSNYCPKCDEILMDQNSGLQCSVCELKYCLECTKISPALLSALKEDTSQNFKWTCNCCKQNFPCMSSLSKQLKVIEEKTHDKIATLEDKIDVIDNKFGERVKHEVNTLKNDLVDDIKTQIKNTLQDDVRKEMYEIEDQKRRALNLIVFNLPESDSKVSHERKLHDDKLFRELCENLGVKGVDVTTGFRLGDEKQGKNRPLKIVMNNKKQRKEILEKVSKIRTLSGTIFEKCIVVKDLTPRQREANKKRRKPKHRQSTQKVDRNATQIPMYDEETICHRQNLEAIIENVDLNDTHNIEQSKLLFVQSQPILSEMPQPQRFIDTSVDMITNITDETVIGGIHADVQPNTNGAHIDLNK